MSAKHTQGDWHNNGLEIRALSGMILATVYPHNAINQSKEEAEANAKLIASAPELLTRLRQVLSCIDAKTEYQKKVFELADQTIKKITE